MWRIMAWRASLRQLDGDIASTSSDAPKFTMRHQPASQRSGAEPVWLSFCSPVETPVMKRNHRPGRRGIHSSRLQARFLPDIRHLPGRAAVGFLVPSTRSETPPARANGLRSNNPAWPSGQKRSVPMADHDYDFFVIGGGSGGVRAARLAAQRGARVALAEAAALGGTCDNVGCIPKKLYSFAAHFAHDFDDAAGFGWDLGTPRLDWARLKANRAREIARLNGVYRQLLSQVGVEIIRGWARLANAHAVQVRTAGGDRRFTARHILIATGGTPTVPSFPG